MVDGFLLGPNLFTLLIAFEPAIMEEMAPALSDGRILLQCIRCQSSD